MLLVKGNSILTYICSYYAVILTVLYVSLQLFTLFIVFLYVYEYHGYGPEVFLRYNTIQNFISLKSHKVNT